MPFVFYVSGHGFGHAARATQVVNALARLEPAAPVVIRASVPEWFLRASLHGLLAPHVASQRAYHHAKAKRLETVDRRLDRLAETLFKIAVASVATWLLLKAGAALDLLPHSVRTAPRDVRTLVSGPSPDAVLVDARSELSEARA